MRRGGEGRAERAGSLGQSAREDSGDVFRSWSNLGAGLSSQSVLVLVIVVRRRERRRERRRKKRLGEGGREERQG